MSVTSQIPSAGDHAGPSTAMTNDTHGSAALEQAPRPSVGRKSAFSRLPGEIIEQCVPRLEAGIECELTRPRSPGSSTTQTRARLLLWSC